MYYIVLDIEATYNKNRKDFKEIIEVGAYKLDENLTIIGSFRTYIKPIWHKGVSKYIEKLTGITNNDVNEGDMFYDALSYFKDWAGSDATFVCWGNADKGMMEYNCLKHMIECGWFSYNYHDLQLTYDSTNHTGKETSLKEAIQKTGLSFEGNHHSALDDARNTVEIMKIIKRQKKSCK